MAKETKREENEESKGSNLDYMRTWGSTRQVKQEFADAHEEDGNLSEEDRIEIEENRPGVNPSTSPLVGADGKPLEGDKK